MEENNIIKIKQLENKMEQVKNVLVERYKLYGRVKCSKCSFEILDKVDIIKYRTADIIPENCCPNCNFTGNLSTFYELEPFFKHDFQFLNIFLDNFVDIYEYVYGDHDPIYSNENFNPYASSFIYSKAIRESYTSLEQFLFDTCKKILKNEERILEFKNSKPSIGNYKEKLIDSGYQEAEVDFKPLYGIQKIRNDIGHYGYIANFEDYCKTFIAISNILIKYKDILIN